MQMEYHFDIVRIKLQHREYSEMAKNCNKEQKYISVPVLQMDDIN